MAMVTNDKIIEYLDMANLYARHDYSPSIKLRSLLVYYLISLPSTQVKLREMTFSLQVPVRQERVA